MQKLKLIYHLWPEMERFELPDKLYSGSDIQDYCKYTIKQ